MSTVNNISVMLVPLKKVNKRQVTIASVKMVKPQKYKYKTLKNSKK